MITVVIYINDRPIFTRSAVNSGEVTDKGEHIYKVDEGTTLYHKRSKGAVVLAKKMLDTIKDTWGK